MNNTNKILSAIKDLENKFNAKLEVIECRLADTVFDQRKQEGEINRVKKAQLEQSLDIEAMKKLKNIEYQKAKRLPDHIIKQGYTNYYNRYKAAVIERADSRRQLEMYIKKEACKQIASERGLVM